MSTTGPFSERGSPDSYFARVSKYTPVEVLLAWVFVNATIRGAGEQIPKAVIEWVAFALFLLLTPVWLWRATFMPGRPTPMVQVLAATISFALWVFALGGPFEQLSFYNPLYGALALLMFSFTVPVLFVDEYVRREPGRPYYGKGPPVA